MPVAGEARRDATRHRSEFGFGGRWRLHDGYVAEGIVKRGHRGVHRAPRMCVGPLSEERVGGPEQVAQVAGKGVD